MGNETGYKLSPEEIECLQDRKWWCFLLSSIFTFLAGLLIVLLWRAFAIICCRSEESPEYSQSDLKQGPRPPRREQEDFESTFVTEAKDWAGELISGQTTTGRILVSLSQPTLPTIPVTCHIYYLCYPLHLLRSATSTSATLCLLLHQLDSTYCQNHSLCSLVNFNQRFFNCPVDHLCIHQHKRV